MLPPIPLHLLRLSPRSLSLLATAALLTLLIVLTNQPPTTPPRAPPRLAKATTAYPSSPRIHKHILAAHDKQNEIFGYTTHIQRRPIVKGGADVFYVLMQVISGEMVKRGEERVAWVLYHDPDIVPLHPHAPLDSLLPPPHVSHSGSTDAFETTKEVCLIFPRPVNGSLSTTVFWLRVQPLTLTLLTATLHKLHTSTSLPTGGRDVAATALQDVLADAEWEGRVVWQPSKWYGELPSTSPVRSEDGGGEQDDGRVFGQARAGNAFTRERELRGLLAQVRTLEKGEESEGWQREVQWWWIHFVQGSGST